jgi:hypothetical protein
LEILVDRPNSSHLAVESQSGHLRGIHSAGIHALANSHCGGLIEISQILLY